MVTILRILLNPIAYIRNRRIINRRLREIVRLASS